MDILLSPPYEILQLISGIAAIVALVSLIVDRVKPPKSGGFLRHQWPFFVFFITLPIILLPRFFLSIYPSAQMSLEYLEFTRLRTRTASYEDVRALKEIDIESDQEPFVVEVSGKVGYPDIAKFEKYFSRKKRPFIKGKMIPCFLVVLPRSPTLPLWYPQTTKPFYIDLSNGFRSVIFLGATGTYRAKDGEKFELRLVVPADPQFKFSTNGPGSYKSISGFGRVLAVSAPLIITTKRPSRQQ